ncbi:MAG: hypothetical protein RMX68_009925 [Aulosira sp. ZfuVER01]|nr:hypothetical protein [Aulosira sp. ZfuVER01]MDZ7998036.1 hypothetical protein [Aulosira sp. DedVER01a]MDZ8050430.1 hypothetical protein [Aulosira sp. ZfuCHP01]
MLKSSFIIAALATVIGLTVVQESGSIMAASLQQTSRVQQPHFKNYPAKPVFQGKPAALAVSTQDIKDYEPQLNATVNKGANFAGHYAIAPHLNRAMGGVDTSAIVDLKTGQVYLPTQLYGYHDQRGAGYNPPRPDGGLHYRANSKLLIIVGQAGGKDGEQGIGRFYYKWENNHLKFLQFVASPYKSQ